MKNPPANAEPQEMQVRSLGRKDPLKEEMATQSSILAGIMPWTEGSGGLQSMGLQSQTRLKVTEHTGMHEFPLEVIPIAVLLNLSILVKTLL